MSPAPQPQAQADEKADAILLLSAFRKAAGLLRLTLPEQAAILGVSRATLAGWKTSPGPDPDKLDRMALFVGILGLASQAFPGERGAEGWLRGVNLDPVFKGRAPLDLLLEGRFESLIRTYDYLQAAVRVW